MTYTIEQIREALRVAKDGQRPDEDDELGNLAWEFTGGNIYRITLDDLECHLENYPDLTDQQREDFMFTARNTIEKAETFGESLQICLELAIEEVGGESE